MAKTNMSVKFSKVYIDEDDLLNLCEIDKEETRYYNLLDTLRQFAGLENVSIQFSYQADLPQSMGDDADDDMNDGEVDES